MSPTSPSARRVGRPSTAVLSRSRIIDMAFQVADSQRGEFSLAAVARALGVQPPAIYNYFANRAEVIAAMREALVLRIDSSGFDTLPWHQAMPKWANDYLHVLGAHPGVIPALATLPVEGEVETMRDYERIVLAFQRADYPSAQIVPAIVAIESFIIGSALDALTPEDNLSPTKAPDLTPTLHSLEAEARRTANERGKTMARQAFEIGLRALIAGLQTLSASHDELTPAPGNPIQPSAVESP